MRMRPLWVSCASLLAAFGLVTVSMHAEADRHIAIVSASANLTTNQFTIVGTHFPTDSLVEIDGLSIVPSSVTETTITGMLPAAVVSNPGSYWLTVRRARRGHRGDEGDRQFLAGFILTVGATGLQGPMGPAGAPGRDGINGINGVDGKDGAQGPAGPAGPSDGWWTGGYLGSHVGDGTPIPADGVERRYQSITVPAGSYLVTGLAVVLNTGGGGMASGHCFIEGDDAHDRRMGVAFFVPDAAFPQNLVNVPLSGADTLLTAGPISVSCEADPGSGPVILQGFNLSIQAVGTLH